MVVRHISSHCYMPSTSHSANRDHVISSSLYYLCPLMFAMEKLGRNEANTSCRQRSKHKRFHTEFSNHAGLHKAYFTTSQLILLHASFHKSNQTCRCRDCAKTLSHALSHLFKEGAGKKFFRSSIKPAHRARHSSARG